MAHARLSPSNHRWPHCPGSVREEARYPDVSGEAAIDGTGSHLLLELCLNNNVRADAYDTQVIGVNDPEKPGGWFVDKERCDRVQMCLNYVERRVKELKEMHPNSYISVKAESSSDPGGMFGRDDWAGTCDITITCEDPEPSVSDVLFIETIDYKDGRGWVDVRDNTQLLSYLIGKMRKYIASGPEKVRPFRPEKVKGCRMTVVQPKTSPVIRYVCSTRADDNFSPKYVVEKAEELSRAARRTDDPDAPCVSGKHCLWCKANPKRGGHCTAATEQSIKVVTDMTNNTDIVQTDAPLYEYINKAVADPKSLTVDQLSQLLSAKDALMAAFDKCESEIVERLNQGVSVPGYAMQPGNSKKVWNADEEDIVKALKNRRWKLDDIYPKKLISPAQVLKSDKLTDTQKKKFEEDYVSVVAGKLSLKKVSHNVAQSDTDSVDSVVQMFSDVPTEAEMMFADVPAADDKPADTPDSNNDVSFF